MTTTSTKYTGLTSNEESGSGSGAAIKTLTSALKAAAKLTQKGASLAGQTIWASADAVGIRDKVELAAEFADKTARKVALKSRVDATKAVNKAKRLASKALDFEEDFDALLTGNHMDFDLLLSAAGAVQKDIAIHAVQNFVFSVPEGSTMVWKARVKKQDIGFCVKEVRDEGMTEIEPLQHYKSDTEIQGQLNPVSYPRNVSLVFDNSHSLTSKTVAYWIAIGQNVSLFDENLGAARSKEVAAADEGPSD